MSYLDLERFAAIDPTTYQTQLPYPFVNPEGVLRDAAYRKLVENPPPLEIFDTVQGKRRAYGQKPHDRLALEYRDGLPIPAPWQEFVDELRSGPYKNLLCRLVGVADLELRFHWHWAGVGDSVSPHCDARRKLGSHIFYLNTEEDWDPSWGGETLVLDDGGHFKRSSAPAFEDFERVIHAEAIGNRSFLFTRRGNSWHGVREIRCPEGRYRKVFIVVLDKPGLTRRLRRLVDPRLRVNPAPASEPGATARPPM